ncbi:methyltransferase type 11 [Niastella vici]|uniref:Methyltransferase type 11 n=1 Tax=Niastella vici TaxID=1703345 RepID=A0A1V9FZP8_9BACT|nr:class I SAM-dependent methyltransferase [Niastella vici]OQP63841.1 methyltransferase type 11 [Niastella vici]
MLKTLPFNEHVAEYEDWFERYPFVFQSEVEAIRELLPFGKTIYGIEIALGTGKFSEALGIKEGVEPAANMRTLAIKWGIEVMDAEAEALPYKDNKYDFVLMVFCVSYFDDLHGAFKEAHRVLKNGGSLILGFIEKNSPIGKFYEARKPVSVFYKDANFYSVERILNELKRAGFRNLSFSQTLFHNLDDIKMLEPSMPGYGKGSFVIIKSNKK